MYCTPPARTRDVRRFVARGVLLLLGCGPTVESGLGDASTSTADASTAADPTTSGAGVSTGGELGSDTAAATSWVSTSTSGSDGCGDYCTGLDTANDDGGVVECDLWIQDCPEGEKCMPWSNNGDGTWNALRCSPIAPDPDAAGEPCSVEGSAVSGIDSCAAGSMCFFVDIDTNLGTCVPLCTGSPAVPSCPDGATCNIASDGVLIICIEACDPSMPACPDGRQCVLDAAGNFSCASTLAGESGFADACDVDTACAPGLFCADPSDVPGCTATQCCDAYCDLTLDDPDAQCPAAADGQICAPFYPVGRAPPGLEHLGYCDVP